MPSGVSHEAPAGNAIGVTAAKSMLAKFGTPDMMLPSESFRRCNSRSACFIAQFDGCAGRLAHHSIRTYIVPSAASPALRSHLSRYLSEHLEYHSPDHSVGRS